MILLARVIALSWLVLFCNQSWAQKNTTVSLTIKAKGIDTRGLIHVAANAAHLNLVIGDELLDRRIDVNQSNIDAVALIESLAAEQHLALKRSGKLLLIASPCRLAQTLDLPVLPSDREKVSFNFQRVPAGRITGPDGILHDEWHIPFDNEDIDGSAGLTIMYWDGALRDELLAIAMVEGWEAQPTETGIQITPNKAVEKCQREAGNSNFETVKFAPPTAPPACPDSIIARKDCEPAELYELSQIITRGWIKSSGNAQGKALIEVPPGVVEFVTVGDYMGRNDGRILKISAKGVEIDERRMDSAGYWREWRLLLPYR